jgi:rod shape-determining protein MreC
MRGSKSRTCAYSEWQSAAPAERRERGAALNCSDAPDPKLPTAVTGRVVADAGGPFVHTVLLDVGRRTGRLGMAGQRTRHDRAGDRGDAAARVLLLTDFNSRIPVLVELSARSAIPPATTRAAPALVFLPLNPRLSVGNACSLRAGAAGRVSRSAR